MEEMMNHIEEQLEDIWDVTVSKLKQDLNYDIRIHNLVYVAFKDFFTVFLFWVDRQLDLSRVFELMKILFS